MSVAMCMGFHVVQQVTMHMIRGGCDACCAAVWEMFYCEAAYDGLMEAQICLGICDGSLRPQFNETCPLAYQKLATQCWAQDPEER